MQSVSFNGYLKVKNPVIYEEDRPRTKEAMVKSHENFANELRDEVSNTKLDAFCKNYGDNHILIEESDPKTHQKLKDHLERERIDFEEKDNKISELGGKERFMKGNFYIEI